MGLGSRRDNTLLSLFPLVLQTLTLPGMPTFLPLHTHTCYYTTSPHIPRTCGISILSTTLLSMVSSGRLSFSLCFRGKVRETMTAAIELSADGFLQQINEYECIRDLGNGATAEVN